MVIQGPKTQEFIYFRKKLGVGESGGGGGVEGIKFAPHIGMSTSDQLISWKIPNHE